MAMAQYDQFLANDYAPLIRDTAGNVMDAETQVTLRVSGRVPLHTLEALLIWYAVTSLQRPPHTVTGQALVDIVGRPFPEPYQSAFQVIHTLQLHNLGVELHKHPSRRRRAFSVPPASGSDCQPLWSPPVASTERLLGLCLCFWRSRRADCRRGSKHGW